MLYSRRGNPGLVVSGLAFAAMTFGQGAGTMAAVSKTGQQDAEAMVRRALDAEINFFAAATLTPTASLE